jgi:hypothetical protein
MSIAEQAQQLGALAEEVPVGAAQDLQGQLESLQQQIAGTLGDTATAHELHGQIGAVSGEITTVATGLEQLRLLIIEKATYHAQ